VSQLPLVTLGMPVRNGVAMVAGALDSMLAQDYPNIEIVVSDNASNDGTSEVLAEYAARHPNMRILRQDVPLTAIDNFMFVLKQARGEYFAWCAHDDTRSPDFVSGLIPAFGDPQVILVFGELRRWDGINPPARYDNYEFANQGLPRWRRLRKAAHMQCYHIYGLWRTRALHAVNYRYTYWWSDLPIILAAASMGTFGYVAGPWFCYLEANKSNESRARDQDYRNPVSRAQNLASLLRAVFVTVARTVGLVPALLATLFTAEKYLRYLPRFMTMRLRSRELHRL